MLIIIQFPITDLRKFIENENSFLRFPQWPFPDPNGEFVRGFGEVRNRTSGGIDSWIGESMICFAKQAIKIDQWPFSSRKDLKIKLKFRRFYFDGISSGKFEIGFIVKSKIDITLREILNELFHINVRVNIPTQEFLNCHLILLSKHLAKKYFFASSYLNKIDNNISEYIKCDNPVIFIDSVEGDRIKNTFYKNQIDDVNSDPISISHSIIKHDNNQLHLWHLKRYYNSPNVANLSRNIRIILLNFNALKQTFNIILNQINQNTIVLKPKSYQSDMLQKYLLEVIRKIDKKENMIEPDSFVIIVKQIEDKLTAGVRQDILAKFKNTINFRPQVFKRIENYFDELEKLNQISNYSNEIIMKKIEVKIKGDNVFSNVGDGDISIDNSYNNGQDHDFIKLLESMNFEIEKIKSSFQSSEYLNIQNDIKSLIQEHKTGNPRKERSHMYLDSIKTVITKVGEIGIPVLGIIEKVISLIR